MAKVILIQRVSCFSFENFFFFAHFSNQSSFLELLSFVPFGLFRLYTHIIYTSFALVTIFIKLRVCHHFRGRVWNHITIDCFSYTTMHTSCGIEVRELNPWVLKFLGNTIFGQWDWSGANNSLVFMVCRGLMDGYGGNNPHSRDRSPHHPSADNTDPRELKSARNENEY